MKLRRDFLIGQETASFSTSDGTAKVGTDYVATVQTITFGDGEA